MRAAALRHSRSTFTWPTQWPVGEHHMHTPARLWLASQARAACLVLDPCPSLRSPSHRALFPPAHPTRSPSAGTYNVSVVKMYKYGAPDTASYQLTITVDGRDQVFNETITPATPNTLSTIHLPACAQCPAITHSVPYP